MKRFLALLIWVPFAFLSPPVTGLAETSLSCTGTSVSFSSEGAGDFRCLCAATERTLEFLLNIGLAPPEKIKIMLVSQIPSESAHALIVSYNPTTHEVLLLDYKRATAEIPAMATGENPLDEEIWCSYAAHELAHVVSTPYLGQGRRARIYGEYIYAITQLSVLSQEQREAYLANYADVVPYGDASEMSELYYHLDPDRFAVKCYLHFIALADPREFNRQLVKT
ncbi:MAG: hypothetical protein C0622_12595, partial [Desulfuromonas sp.]